MKIINLDDIWVTANFKESQLRYMRPGQRATISVDAYGKKYNGHVESIAGASGALFSLLPPENATGNYVKVVQRIPVKITFDPGETKEHILRPGMSVEPKVWMQMSSAALTADGAALPRPAINPWIIAMAVTLATFMEVLDTSIANVSLPHIAGSLSAGTDESTWVLTSYLVSNAIVLPLSGWISSIIGRKRFYMSCVAIFTVSSFLCGLAPNLGMLIFFRILQGAGGGGLQPSEQAILADTFPPAKRGMAFAVYGLAVVLAPAIGPTLGGWITDNFTWRWIFLLNIPVGILSLMLTSRLIQDPPYLKRKKLSETKIDYIGLGLVALGLGTLQIVLDKGQRDDWFESHFIVVLSVIAAASLLFLIYWEWTRRRSGHRPAPVHQPDVRRLQSPDVHAGLCAARQHRAAAAVHADPAGLYRPTGRAGAVAGRLQPDAADAAGGLYALPFRCPQDDDGRAARAFLLPVSHDQLRPGS